jgi:hypothetical protein
MQTAWGLATAAPNGRPERTLQEQPLEGIAKAIGDLDLPASGNPATEDARKAILENIRSSCGVGLAEAISVQAKHSGQFMVSSACKGGRIGADYKKTVLI